ncbi:Uncharacterised protein [Klebsiella oxytoca]|nr:Uncharacterised protein [Klebsiella oxytoca]
MASQILIKFAEQRIGGFPTNAGIGHGDTVFHIATRLLRGLVSFVDIALNHQTNNGTITIF